MAEVRITPTENGPYKIEGPVELLDPQGDRIEPPGQTIFLCRCGGSQNKPFCDGTHSKIGFKGAMRAVQAAEAGASETAASQEAARAGSQDTTSG